MPILTCEFCGKEMPTKTAYGVTVPIPCQCEGAVAERERLDLEEKRQNWKAAYVEALSRTGIPEGHMVHRQWGDGDSVYLYGEQGRGKTEMAFGALRKWIKDGIRPYEEGSKRFYSSNSGKYVYMPELMMQIRSAYEVRGVTEEDVIDAMGGVGMLVMDDLGTGKVTDWVIEKVKTILDMRYRRRDRLKTILTTQYDLERLCSIFGSVTDSDTAIAIRSRIEGMCRIMHIQGVDMRVNNSGYVDNGTQVL